MAKINKTKEKVGPVNWIIFGVLIFYSVVMILLMVWGVLTSLKSDNDFIIDPVLLPGEDGFMIENFIEMWQKFVVPNKFTPGVKIGVEAMILNTILYCFGGAFVMTTCYCIMAYITSRYNYLFSKIIYLVVVITMVIPIIGSTPATLDFMIATGLYDTWLGAYIMKFNFLGMYFLVFHAMYKSLSNEFYEAAIIDGANEWQVFLKIMVPLVAPTYGTIFLIKFIEFWNDYMTPLMYLPTHPTLAYGVQYMATNGMRGMSRPPKKMASCMVMMLPILFVYIIFRNKIMGNVTMGGVKE